MLAKTLGLQYIDVESDCLLVIQALSKNDCCVIGSIIDDCRVLFSELRGGSCSYIPHSCNIATRT